MRIGVRVNVNDFFYDIHSLVKSFYPEEDVSVFDMSDTVKSDAEYDLLIPVTVPHYTDRPAAKSLLKRDLYLRLQSMTGTRLPWGTLSGIRPTRIPMQILAGGGTEEEAVRKLMTESFVSEEKARLAAEIAARERKVLEGIFCGEGSYSLYIHIPFCPTICDYCTFSSNPLSAWKKFGRDYIDCLFREMRQRRDIYMQSGYAEVPTTVYIGGGTPTVLAADELEELLAGIKTIWNLEGTLEFTVEAGRPDSITPEKLRVLKEAGVTRISVNPQTMQDGTLERIGRHHTAAQTEEAFLMAREADFDNINMDIILGLPGETGEDLKDTLNRIMRLSPDSLTVHSLALKRASKLRSMIREDRESDPEADRGEIRGLRMENSLEMMALSSRAALEMGMHPYYLYRQKNMRGNLENTGFSVPGKECLYNILIMEELQTILAFGAGASTKYVYEDGRIERDIRSKDIRAYLEI